MPSLRKIFLEMLYVQMLKKLACFLFITLSIIYDTQNLLKLQK